MKYLDPRDLGIRALSFFRIDIVKYLVHIDMIDFKWKCSKQGDETPLFYFANQFPSIDRPEYGCKAQDFTETMRYLLEQGIKASKKVTENFNPLRCFLNCNIRKYKDINEDKKQSIVTVCRMLLDAMKRETGLSLPVPKLNVLHGLTAIVFQHQYNSQDQCAIDLMMTQLFQMFLWSGVNPHSVLPSRRSLMWEVNHDLVLYRKHKFKATAEFCRLLFICGEKPNVLHCFLSI